jgi:hypothetical protein
LNLFVERQRTVVSVTTVITEPLRTRDGTTDYNIWCPVAAADALEAWLLRGRGDAAAQVATDRLTADPGLGDNPDFIRDQVAVADHSYATYYDAADVAQLIGTGHDLLRTRLTAAA